MRTCSPPSGCSAGARSRPDVRPASEPNRHLLRSPTACHNNKCPIALTLEDVDPPSSPQPQQLGTKCDPVRRVTTPRAQLLTPGEI